jgi:type IV pilus assembly protein PilN
MIKINLVAEAPAAAAKPVSRPQFSLGARQGDIILLIVLAVACIVVGTQWYLLSNKRAELRLVEQERRRERDELLQYIKKVEELEAKRESLRQKIEVIEELKNNQRGPVKIMDEVSRALPELAWLTKLTLKDNELVLDGTAMDENAVANYIANLDASPFFEEPELKNLARARGDTFNFTLRCIFNISPPEIQAAAGAQAAAAGAE